MSYSFSVRAKSKDDAAMQAGVKMAEVVESQPTHEADKVAATNAVTSLIEVLVDPKEDESVTVNVSGSLGWRAEGEFTSANLSVSVAVVKD